MRLTPSWIEEARRMLHQPALDRQQFLESLTPDPDISATAICEALPNHDPDFFDLISAVGRLIPASRLFPILGDMSGVHAVMMPQYLQPFCAVAALHELKNPSSPFLRQAVAAIRFEWWDGDRSTVLGALPEVAALAGHPDPDTARAAAMLALEAKIITPEVTAVLRRRLRELPELLERRKAGDEDVGELGRGDLFWGIARAGEELRDLAPDFLLHEDNSLYAAVAAVGVNAQTLAPEIEKLYAATPAPPAEDLKSREAYAGIRARLSYAYAFWYLGGPDACFDEAVSLASTSSPARHQLLALFGISAPSQRLRQALRRLAEEDDWRSDIVELLG